ncbi:MAG: FAD-binding oxidoreductase [Desulfobacterales bacterium]|nr:FAD-binding oxidoreductase [Desulfobacterales bacterium]
MVAKKTIEKGLKSIVGEERVSTDPADNAAYSSDVMTWLLAEGMSDYLVAPSNVEETQEVVRLANKYKIPVTVVTYGTNVAGLAIARKGGIMLVMKRLNRILEINEDTQTATIEPGVTHGKLERACYGKSVIPMHIIGSPVGSAMAIPFFGQHAFNGRHRCDRIVGIEMVLANGELIRTGSFAAPGCETLNPYNRYGAGPDLAALNYGNWAFGVFTKAIIRLFPRQEVTEYMLFAFSQLEPALRAMLKIEKRDITLGTNLTTKCYFARITAPDPEMLSKPEEMKKLRSVLPEFILQTYIAGTPEQVALYRKLIEKDVSEYGGAELHLEGRKKAKADSQAWSTGMACNRQFQYPITMSPCWCTIPVALRMNDLVKELFKKHDIRDPVTGEPAEIDFWCGSCERCVQIFFNQSVPWDPLKPDTIEKARACWLDFIIHSVGEGNAIPLFGSQAPEYVRIVNEIKKTIDPNNVFKGIISFEF